MMFRIVAVQFLATLVLSASCLFVGWVLAGSFLAGGIAAAVPNGFVAWRFTAAGVRLDARTLIVAEGCRWVLSIGILAPALVLVSLDIVALLGAFALMQLVPIVVPLLRQRRREPEGLAMLDKKGA
jgi:F0F1-type ATP synthase assembly protein I